MYIIIKLSPDNIIFKHTLRILYSNLKSEQRNLV